MYILTATKYSVRVFRSAFPSLSYYEVTLGSFLSFTSSLGKLDLSQVSIEPYVGSIMAFPHLCRSGSHRCFAAINFSLYSKLLASATHLKALYR